MSKNKAKKTQKQKIWTLIKVQFVLLLLIITALGYYYAGGYASTINDMKKEADAIVARSTDATFKKDQTSILYDAYGNEICRLNGAKDSYYVTIENIPNSVKSAVISIEDKKFYSHSGIDYKAIMRAVSAMIKNGEVTQGASTITQQLARNMFLSMDKTWERKVEEIFVATALEKKYSKDKILEYYLNNIYFSNGYYGIQAASDGYFGKNLDKLTVSEAAFLIAIPNSPNYYDPVNHIENTIARRDLILQEMYEDGKITENTYKESLAEKMILVEKESAYNNYVESYAYYCATKALMQTQGFEFRTKFNGIADMNSYNWRYKELYEECNTRLFSGGYRIYTSIDLDMQNMLQEAIDDNLKEFEGKNDEGIYLLQGAGACIDNETGMVKAIVGGRDQDDIVGYTLNRAYQSFRQPGSSIKPLIVYTPAIERGYNADTIVIDEELEEGPKNADGVFSGEMTLREAVMRSKNTIAYKLFDELSPVVGLSYLEAMDFAQIVEADYINVAALGGLTNGVSALEMAKGYATIENDGIYREPNCISKINDMDQNTLWSYEPEVKMIYEVQAARQMTDILQSVVEGGTAKGLGLENMPCAGKTGTTNNNYDGWFCGYTPYYTTAIWVGYDMPKKLPGLTGASYPGDIWHDYMVKIHENKKSRDFLPVIEIVEENVEEEDALYDEEGNLIENEEVDEEQSEEITDFNNETQNDNIDNEENHEPVSNRVNDSEIRGRTTTIYHGSIPDGVLKPGDTVTVITEQTQY